MSLLLESCQVTRRRRLETGPCKPALYVRSLTHSLFKPVYLEDTRCGSQRDQSAGPILVSAEVL